PTTMPSFIYSAALYPTSFFLFNLLSPLHSVHVHSTIGQQQTMLLLQKWCLPKRTRHFSFSCRVLDFCFELFGAHFEFKEQIIVDAQVFRTQVFIHFQMLN